MSGLLQRMAKRAHGTLDGVQPLIAPKFAPAAGGEFGAPARGGRPLRSMPTREEGLESTFTEETTGRQQALGQDDGMVAEARGAKATGRKRGRSELPIDAHPSSPHRAQNAATEDDEAVEQQVDLESRKELQPRRAIAARAPEPTVRVLPRAPARANTEGHANEDSLVAADRDERETAVEPARQHDRLRRPADSPARRHPGAEPEYELQADRTGVGPRRISAQRASAANASKAADGQERDAEPEEKAEIHISIGNIELRAPRAETRPQPAPFRPRVTLDEFLRRRSEAQR